MKTLRMFARSSRRVKPYPHSLLKQLLCQEITVYLMKKEKIAPTAIPKSMTANTKKLP